MDGSVQWIGNPMLTIPAYYYVLEKGSYLSSCVVNGSLDLFWRDGSGPGKRSRATCQTVHSIHVEPQKTQVL